MHEDFSDLRLPREVVAAFPPDRDGLFDAFRGLVTDRMLEVVARCDYESQVAEHLAGLKDLRENGATGPIGWNPNEVLSLFRWSGDYKGQHGLSRDEFYQTVGFCASALAVVPERNENRTMPGADNIIVLFEVVTALEPAFDMLYASFLVHNLDTLDPWDNDFIDCAFALTALCTLWDEPAFAAQRERLVAWFVLTQAEIVPWFTKECGWVAFSRVPGQEEGQSSPFDDMEPASSFAHVSDGILGERWCVLCQQVIDKWGREDAFSRLVAEAGLIHLNTKDQLNAEMMKDMPELMANVVVDNLQRKVGDAAVKLGTWLKKLGGGEKG